MLGLSLKFNPRLVISQKFRYRAPKTGAFTTRALLSRNYNACENSLQLPNPDTRNPPSNPEPKGPLVQIGGGYFCNTPYILDKRVPKSWFTLSHRLLLPFEIPGHQNLSAPATKPQPSSVRHLTDAQLEPLPRKRRPPQQLDVPRPPPRMRIRRPSRRPAGSTVPSSTSNELLR